MTTTSSGRQKRPSSPLIPHLVGPKDLGDHVHFPLKGREWQIPGCFTSLVRDERLERSRTDELPADDAGLAVVAIACLARGILYESELWHTDSKSLKNSRLCMKYRYLSPHSELKIM